MPLEWEITRREFRVDETGDTASVFVDALAIEGVVEGEAFSVEFADGCVRASAAGESFEQCNEGAFDDTTGLLEETPEIERLIDIVTDAFSDVEEVGLEMRRTDGLWYVSPTTTSTEAVSWRCSVRSTVQSSTRSSSRRPLRSTSSARRSSGASTGCPARSTTSTSSRS